jgi:hypothetical protein
MSIFTASAIGNVDRKSFAFENEKVFRKFRGFRKFSSKGIQHLINLK